MASKNIIIALAIFLFILPYVLAIGNPAAVYCEEMGYDFDIEKTSSGEIGICVVDRSHKYDAWDFFQGKTGQDYSYCKKKGYNIITERGRGNPYSEEYAVCVPKYIRGDGVQMSELMNLKDKLGEGSYEESLSVATESSGSGEEFVASGSLPDYFDWRDYDGEDWMTSVRSQGSCGACWAFSGIGTVEAKANIENNDPDLDWDLAEQELVSCGSGSCSGGHIGNALSYARDNGVVDEVCFPYVADDVACNRCADWQDRLSFIDSWASISSWNGKTPLEVMEITKQALVEKGPLSAKIDMSGVFGEDGIYRCEEYYNSHGVVIIGYNDTGNIHTSYWIVRNSWGSGWNQDGYFKVGWDVEYQGEYYSHCGILSSPPYAVNILTPQCVNDSDCDGNQVCIDGDCISKVVCENEYCGLTEPGLASTLPGMCAENWPGSHICATDEFQDYCENICTYFPFVENCENIYFGGSNGSQYYGRVAGNLPNGMGYINYDPVGGSNYIRDEQTPGGYTPGTTDCREWTSDSYFGDISYVDGHYVGRDYLDSSHVYRCHKQGWRTSNNWQSCSNSNYGAHCCSDYVEAEPEEVLFSSVGQASQDDSDDDSNSKKSRSKKSNKKITQISYFVDEEEENNLEEISTINLRKIKIQNKNFIENLRSFFKNFFKGFR